MHSIPRLVALATTFSSAMAVSVQGFNYGSTFTNGAPKQQSDFENEFSAAGNLVGAPGDGFHSARLYTTVQGGTANAPISAIPAALKTQTSLLLGIWASAGDAVFANELQALKSAISTYGSEFADLVVGISVGSEDLYRISPTGIQNKENPGASPDTIATYIKRVREAISGTPLANAPIGHVDTWTAWVNGSNHAVVEASDWIGFDAYPYFQTTMANDISNSKDLFDSAFQATKDAVGVKPIWITETGYPVSGKTAGQAVPSVENAKMYWDQVGCPLFGNAHIWWYTFQDAAPTTPSPSFGIIGSTLTSTPIFDLSCKRDTNVKPPPAAASSSSSDAPASSTKSKSGASSSSDAESSSTSVPAIGSGSPGASGGLPSSQLSLETSTLSSSVTAPSGTGPAGPSSTGGFSSEPGANSTVSGASPPTPSTTGPATVGNGPGSGAVSLSGSVGALLAAVMVAAIVV